MEQRSEEWFEARRGKVTASRIYDILKTIRSGAWAASRRNYAAELVTERISGKTHPRFYSNEHMEWGKDQEPAARDAYVAKTGAKLVEVGMIEHPRIPMSGASPDGLIDDEGLLEVKCLIPANHLDLLLSEEIPDQYVLQMNWQMACTGRKWCDFVSYDPSQAEHMQLFIKRVHRDEKEIKYIEDQVERFLQEVDDTVTKLKEKYKNAE